MGESTAEHGSPRASHLPQAPPLTGRKLLTRRGLISTCCGIHEDPVGQAAAGGVAVDTAPAPPWSSGADVAAALGSSVHEQSPAPGACVTHSRARVSLDLTNIVAHSAPGSTLGSSGPETPSEVGL